MTEVFIIDDEEQIADLLGEAVSLSNMPKMDGIEVIRELSKNGSKASLILMSGYDVGVLRSAEKLAHAYELEIMTSINKPIQLDELMMALISHRKTLGSKPQPPDQNIYVPTPEDLEAAIDADQLVLHYQPQIDLKSGEIIAAEALVRWMHPEHGMLFPDSFIPLAETSGLMGKLTSTVLDIAITRVSHQQSFNCQVPISVNVSATNISSLGLPEELKDKIRIFKLDPSLLTIEITESALMGELVTSLDILTRIRMKGFALSIDDFGTGFSSLSQLHRVPFNELKVDKSFVMEMDTDREAKAIVKTCIMLGHELNMRVVAEGVESETTLTMLKEMGCDIAQGYYITRPLSEENFQTWLEEHPSKLCSPR